MKAKKKRVIPGLTFNGRDNYNIELSCSYTVGGTCDLHIKNAPERYYRNNYTSACSCKF